MEEISRNGNAISVSEVVFDGQTEQGVELDYVLPDYYPEIFKILSCRLIPSILSYSMLGDAKLSLDGCVDIKVMYLAEGSSDIYCIEQRYTYTKSVDLGRSTAAENVVVRLEPKPDYCNCRAVSGRRIDVRGAVSTKIRITDIKTCEIPALPTGLQIKSQQLDCCGRLLSVEKQFSCKEEIETGAHGLAFIVRSSAIPKINDIRIIADKAVIKGMITIYAAYGIKQPDSSGSAELENMTADIPISQIIDLEGVDDSFSCSADMDILNLELSCNADSGIIGCNILATVRVRCTQRNTVEIPCDVYSTEYETTYSVKPTRLIKSSGRLERQLSVKTECSAGDTEIANVLDCSADIFNLSCRIEDGNPLLMGTVCYKALCRSAEGIPCCIEKQEGFEIPITADSGQDITELEFSARCCDTDYSIRSDGALDITARIEFTANVYDCGSVDMIERVMVDEEKPRTAENNYALRICYADGEEDCWSIAKRYGTSVEAVMNENDIEDRDMLLSGMILIPAI